MTVSKKPSGTSGGKFNGPEEIPARRGFSISYMGKTLLSRIDPIAQGEKLAAEVPISEETLYFCPSPLYGYGLSVLLDKLSSSSAILCVEADEKLFEISRKAFSNIALLHTCSLEELCAFVNKSYGTRKFRRVITVHLGGGWQLYADLYQEMEKALGRMISVEWSNAMTLIRLGRLYARNLIRNLALLPASKNISALDYSSAPILVLGAGPSLDALLDELSLLFGSIPTPDKRQFRIVCADTCLAALIERDIHPDLVVILESQHWNLRDFTGLKNRKINSALDLSALPSSARVLAGDRYFFSTPWTELRLFKRLTESTILPKVFPPLGSVGISCVAIALGLGTGPVLAGGIDFAYSLDAYHARFTPGDRENSNRQNRLRGLINAAAVLKEGGLKTLSKEGKQVRSEPSMRNYRELFEQQFGGNPRLFDIMGTGLPLGIKSICIKEAASILSDNYDKNGTTYVNTNSISKSNIIDFIRSELEDLDKLKKILTGEEEAGTDYLEGLIDKLDYLWAHFPETAGAGGRRPPASDLSFLKRVRTEIDPFVKLLQMSLDELYC